MTRSLWEILILCSLLVLQLLHSGKRLFCGAEPMLSQSAATMGVLTWVQRLPAAFWRWLFHVSVTFSDPEGIIALLKTLHFAFVDLRRIKSCYAVSFS